MKASRALFVVAVPVVLLAASSFAANPNDPPPSSDSLIREELPETKQETFGSSLQGARGAFLEVDRAKAGEQIRKAAAQLREAAATVADNSRASLHKAAEDLDHLATRVEQRSVKSVHELDHAFARASHAMARHHLEVGKQSWRDREHKRAGWRLRAAADNVELAVKWSGHQVSAAAQEAVKDSRFVAGKLVEGGGYAVDEVGRAFERLGKQVEVLGEKMEPAARKNPDRLVVPK